MQATDALLNTRQLSRYSYLRAQGHGALRAYRAARAMIGGNPVTDRRDHGWTRDQLVAVVP